MNIHEYQAKQLFNSYGINVLKGDVAFNVDDAVKIAEGIDSKKWVVKAQIHAGGRGKGGGVKIANSIKEVEEYSNNILGMNLITPQTGVEGKKVLKVYVEEGCQIKKEYYLGIVLDRAKGKFVMMASTEGGMEIEKVAEEMPEKIIKVILDPLMGLNSFQARQLSFAFGIPKEAMKDFVRQVTLLSKIAVEKDFTLVEINPLILTEDNKVIALDAKVNIDDNALFRNSDLKELLDESEVDPKELEAEKYDLSYVKLDGKLGCMVNGAGLAMATMDIIKLSGGDPANFLDVGGTASAETVEAGFRIILKDPNVKAILLNIFGGIVRCDRVANGVVQAYKNIGEISVPIVVRLQGTNSEEGAKIIRESGLEVFSTNTLQDAADKINEILKK